MQLNCFHTESAKTSFHNSPHAKTKRAKSLVSTQIGLKVYVLCANHIFSIMVVSPDISKDSVILKRFRKFLKVSFFEVAMFVIFAFCTETSENYQSLGQGSHV